MAAFISCDVAVVGSGPAGAEAARVLAQAGVSVVVVEREKLPRYKTCGGGILGRAVALLGGGELPAERVCRRAEFVLSEGLRFSSEGNEPMVVMTMRDRFDAWLMERARGAGAKLVEGCVVEDVVREADHVRVVTSAGEMHTKYVVAADGAKSIVARRCGWKDGRAMAPALEWEVQVGSADFDRLSGAARFDFHAAPGGYGWVFPKREHLSIGVGVMYGRKAGVNLHACTQRYMEYLGIGRPVAVAKHGFVIPLTPRTGGFVKGRVMLTGDAAGFADPVTAEGIGHAILSGQLAGRAIAENFANAEGAAAAYAASIDKEIVREVAWGRRLAWLLYGRTGVRDALFRWKGERLTKVMTEVVAGRRSYSSLLSAPGNYLKLVCG